MANDSVVTIHGCYDTLDGNQYRIKATATNTFQLTVNAGGGADISTAGETAAISAATAVPNQAKACGGTVAATGWTIAAVAATETATGHLPITGAYFTAGGGVDMNATTPGQAAGGAEKRLNCCTLTANCAKNTGDASGSAPSQAEACGGAINVTGWTIKSTLPTTAITGDWATAGGIFDMTAAASNAATGSIAAQRLACCDFTGSCTATEGTAAGTDPTQAEACGGTEAVVGYTLKATIPSGTMTHAHITAGGGVTMNAAGANAAEKAVKAANCCDQSAITCAKTTAVTTSAVVATQNAHCGGAYGTPPAAGAWKLKATLPTTAITGITLTSTATELAAGLKTACCTQECTPIAVSTSPAGVAAPGIFAALLAAVAAALRM
jgi:hypothetical protein